MPAIVIFQRCAAIRDVTLGARSIQIQIQIQIQSRPTIWPYINMKIYGFEFEGACAGCWEVGEPVPALARQPASSCYEE
eukprot:scaffold24863_cov112-Isochrysis_galbana.AAC.5